MKSSRRSRFVLFLFVCAVSTVFSAASQAQTTRSRRFIFFPFPPFHSYVRFDPQPQFDSSVPMTIEAWVFRESNSGANRQTIVSHDTDFASSYFFGLEDNVANPRLIFKRGGSLPATSTGTIANENWTHVAVTYDGSTVRFYIDGNAAGTASLTNVGANRFLPLLIGARALDTSSSPVITDAFSGYLDEVRIWSVVRTQSQIRNARFHEQRSGTGLVAVFPSAGLLEELSGVSGLQGGPTLPDEVCGILPRDLLVPKAAGQPCVDGVINTTSEYAGAEQLVIRYRDPVTTNQTDAIAYLVHTDNDLYIGIKNIHGGAPSTSWTAILLDPLGLRNPQAQSTDVHLKAPNDGTQPTWLVGNGSGNYVAPGAAVNECTVATCASSGCSTWQHASSFCLGEFNGPCHEFRISRSRLGTFLQEDGLAIGHFWLDGITGFDHFGPGDAFWNQPATWARVRYSENQALIPRVTVGGRVDDRSPSHPMAHYPVNLLAGSSLVAQTQTTTTGFFSFTDVFVSPTSELHVQVANCSNCTCVALAPEIGGGTPRPVSEYPYEVVFPPCSLADSPCTYPNVNFRLRVDGAPITITNASMPPGTMGGPAISGHGRIVLRDTPLKELPPTEVVLTGTGFSDCMTVWFRRKPGGGGCQQFPTICDMVEVEVKAGSISADGTSVTVIAPEVPSGWGSPSAIYPGSWAIFDPTAGRTWQASGYAIGPDFALVPINIRDYSKLYGFEFRNGTDVHSWKTFTAVYGNNAYICVGAFGVCACRVPSPWVLLWFPVYTIAMGNQGMCTGMASTSLDFFHGNLSVEDFQEGAHFPAGLRGRGPSGIFSPKPDRYTFHLCGAYTPKNLWAHIMVGKGVILTHEFMQEVFDDMNGGSFSIDGNPMARFAEISLNQEIFMVPSLADSHAVVGYHTEVDPVNPTLRNIHVWDNNLPEVERTIVIDSVTNTYEYTPRGYTGSGLYTVPYSVWTNPRHFISLGDIVDFIFLSTIGANVDSLISCPDLPLAREDGSAAQAVVPEWGWHADGTFVDALPGLVAIPIPSPRPLGSTEEVPLVETLSMTAGAPNVQINCHGEEYGFIAAQGGTVTKIDAWGTSDGEIDNLAFGYDVGKLSTFRWRPSAPRTGVLPQVGMVLPGDRQVAVFKWSGLQVTPGQEVGFTALPDQHGASFHNDTNSPTTHILIVDMVDGPSEAAATLVFGPFDVPAGATHITRMESWPAVGTIRVEMDLGSDGTIDESSVVSGRVLPWLPVLPPSDEDFDGIDDALNRRCDMDVDGDVDLPDWGTMFACLAGPTAAVSGTPCERGDVNFDLHLDIADVIRFQQLYTGPSGNHGCCVAGGAGCDDAAIQACVCAQDPACCTTWSAGCVVEVEMLGCGECPSDHDCCLTGAVGCDNPLIEQCVCAADPFCCQFSWDNQCASEVESLACGACGGPDHTCCAVGAPGCSSVAVADCVCQLDPFCCQFAWDETCIAEVGSFACSTCPATHDCCVTGGAGCDDADVASCVCAADPVCCQGSWTSACVNLVNSAGCGLCTNAVHDCCTTGGPGCNDLTIEDCVCASDAYCCTTAWDALCIDLVEDVGCGVCGTEHACCSVGGPGCADPVVEGCVCNLVPHCCDDIWDAECVAAVEGIGCSACGFATHSCCQTGAVGCVDTEVAACVCALDSFCCDFQWDGLCVSEVESLGCAFCDTHDCCETGGIGCANEFIMQCVCSIDSFCCGTSWDTTCVNEVGIFECGSCP